MRGLRTIFALLLMVLWSAHPGFSQAVSATLLGTVTDASGAVVPNAKVTLTETNTGVSHTIPVNSSGNFTSPNLPPGNYSVSVEMTGFKKELRNDIKVDVGSTVRVDVQLQPGNVSETIEVTSAAAVLKTDRADISTTIETVQLEELPLGVNGNFQLLLTLVPGTSDPTFQHSQFFNASSSVQMNTYGQPRMSNNYQIEGIDNNERTGLLQVLIPPKEAIQQVEVSTSNHDPELGRSTGAVSNVVLKSGTNLFHGAAYWNLQNSALDTRSFFNPSVGHVAYNQFGGNLGGPIKKNKLFFFADYLKTMDHEANTNLQGIPSMPFRTGDLSSDPTHLVYDPDTTTPGDQLGGGRTPFPGNIIPANRINPVSAKILALLPPPNQPLNAAQSNDYYALLPFQKTTDHIDVKIDNQVSSKDRVSARFSYEKPVSFQAPEFGDAGGPAQGAFEGVGSQRTYSSGLNYDRVISPTLITQVRFGVAYYNNISSQSDYGKNDSTAIGIPGVNINDFTTGMVGINISGWPHLWWAIPPACPGSARKPISISSTPGPRSRATTPSSGAWISGAFATACCRTRPSARAA
jgi:Carboxypeptidase regulatory-like domain